MKTLNFCFCCILLTIIYSCNKVNVDSLSSNQSISSKPANASRISATDENDDGFMVLGKQLQNPYSIENMGVVFKNLKIQDVKVKVTNYYVRFLPSNEEELVSLQRNTEFELYKYPLDYEIVKRGNKYKDPSNENNNFSWLYAVLKKDGKFPKIKHEILSELYLPTEDEEIKDERLIEEIDTEALRITGNLPEKKKGRISAYNPSGSILMFDDVKNMSVPLKGCKVRIRKNIFSSETTLTDNNGNFYFSNSYTSAVTYSIIWSRADFDILDSDYDVAYYTGPQQSSPWNLIINGGSKTWVYALAHRGAYEYYYNTISGLDIPNYSRISVRDLTEQNWRPGLSIPLNPGGFKIKIWSKVDDVNNNNLGYRYRSGLETFGTVIHELGHRVHYTINTSGYNGDEALAESWGEGVRWNYTVREYGKCGDAVFVGSNPSSPLSYSNSSNFADNFQKRYSNSWNNTQGYAMLKYTPIVIDLFDTYNQQTILGFNYYANDNVSNYTILHFQEAIRNTGTWNGVRDFLKNNYPNSNATSANMNLLFTEW